MKEKKYYIILTDYVVVRLISQYREFSFDHFLFIVSLKTNNNNNKPTTLFKTSFKAAWALNQCFTNWNITDTIRGSS